MLGAYMALDDTALTIEAVTDTLKETLPPRYL
jgi:hypothetical protein